MNKMRFFMPIGVLLMAAGFSAAVMLLWNWLMPSMFGLAVINFWQALGLLALGRILFGSFGIGHGRRNGGWHGRHHLREKWTKMTPEQRQEFVNKRMEHFGRGDFFGRRGCDFNAGENTSKSNE
jgi:hypothetical protein